ncbi:hypothetical protein CRG98_037418 [Punica granatum]|uniref:C2H2-type domain-containing protein n=1 Tax=Punica granatum TaxID=22663 RepID=A0A2I0IDV2_PUNGR|nr:hypothetical protein CRG98_037418 [Punica granatum]
MSNFSGEEGSFSSGNTGDQEVLQHDDNQRQLPSRLLDPSNSQQAPGATDNSSSTQPQQPSKKKRNLPGTPDPNAEVIALSPTTLMATNRFVCEICNKGFQRDQNLQLHRRGHNLPWKLRQRTNTEPKKRVYICPEPTCVHHNPARALGDLTGIKKHYSRKHGEKKWKCDKCSKKYAVQSDWKAHQKTCGTREYKCDCGTIFSRRDSFITHRAFCDALAEENNKVNQGLAGNQMPELISSSNNHNNAPLNIGMNEFATTFDPKNPLKSLPQELIPVPFKSNNLNSMAMSGGIGGMFSSSSGTLFGGPRSSMQMSMSPSSSSLQLSSNTSSSGFNYLQDTKTGCQVSPSSAHMSATALLQKAAQMGASASNSINSPMMQKSFTSSMAGPNQFTPIRPPSYKEASQQQNDSSSTYEQHRFPSQPEPNFIGTTTNGSFTNHLLQKNNPQETMSHLIDGANGIGSPGPQPMPDHLGIFSNMYGPALDHQGNQLGFMKASSRSIGDDQDSSGSSMVPSGPDRNSQAGPSRFGAAADSNNVMTVDFLGIGGGSRGPGSRSNLHEQQMSVMGHFGHGESAMEKQIWDL